MRNIFILQYDRTVVIYKTVNGLCPDCLSRDTCSQVSAVNLLSKKSVRSGNLRAEPSIVQKQFLLFWFKDKKQHPVEI